MKTAPFVIAAALGLALTATASYAGEVRVGYSDLNLASAEGQQALSHRIDRAAKSACGFNEISTGTRFRSADATACYKAAHAKARNAMAVVVEDARLGG